MSKVDWITWKTDPNEIINPDKIDEEITEYFHNYDSYMNTMIYDQLNAEMNHGGLTKEAFNVSGISPAHDMTVEIINAIEEIKQTMKNLRENVREVTTNQKDIEKKQLIAEIEEKIEKEKAILQNVESQKEMKDQTKKMQGNPEDMIDTINDRIKKLTERLEIAKSL